MKNFKILLVLALVLNAIPNHAQFIEKLGKKAKASAERTLERKVEEKTEETDNEQPAENENEPVEEIPEVKD